MQGPQECPQTEVSLKLFLAVCKVYSLSSGVKQSRVLCHKTLTKRCIFGVSLSEPHTGWSLSWFRTSRVQTVRTIKYDGQAIQVLSWSRTSRVRTVWTIKYDGQAIQVLSWSRTSRVRTVWTIKYDGQAIQVLSWSHTSRVQTMTTIKYGWQTIQVLSWSRTSRVRTVWTIKYDGQAIQRFIRRMCRLWVLRGRWSEGRET